MSKQKDFMVVEDTDNKIKLYEIIEAETPDGEKVTIRTVIGNDTAKKLYDSLKLERNDIKQAKKNYTEQMERDQRALQKIKIIQKVLKPHIVEVETDTK